MSLRAKEVEEDPDTTLTSSSNCNRDINSADDSRLRRLAETRRIRQAMEEDDDAVEEKRRMIRERLLKLRRQEESDLPTVDVDDDDDEEEEKESEYETDFEEEEEGSRNAMEKPVYFSKQERETIVEQKKLKAEVKALEEAVKRRKRETKQIVVDKIREDYNTEMSSLVDEKEADDDAEEYDKWKARETARIKRDREEVAFYKENKRVRRNMMTTEEDEIRNNSGAPPKQKRRFMHKYYHTGAFFQDGICCNRDYYSAAPTGDDQLNKTILPKVMQVNNFGRTHLLNEDTTHSTRGRSSHQIPARGSHFCYVY